MLISNDLLNIFHKDIPDDQKTLIGSEMDELVDWYIGGKFPSDHQTLHVFAGAPGVGKTNFAHSHIDTTNPDAVLIDMDEVLTHLGCYQTARMELGKRPSVEQRQALYDTYRALSIYCAHKLMNEAANRGHDIVFAATMTHGKSHQLLEDAKKNGMEVRVTLIDQPLEATVTAIEARNANPSSRFTPMSDATGKHAEITERLFDLVRFSDVFEVLWRNDYQTGQSLIATVDFTGKEPNINIPASNHPTFSKFLHDNGRLGDERGWHAALRVVEKRSDYMTRPQRPVTTSGRKLKA